MGSLAGSLAGALAGSLAGSLVRPTPFLLIVLLAFRLPIPLRSHSEVSTQYPEMIELCIPYLAICARYSDRAFIF